MMVQDLSITSVTAIESIGPRTAERLDVIDVRVIADLYRFSASTLHAAVATVANIERVQGWRTMAYLLWIPDMTPQWAEACWKAGIHTLERFSFLGLAALREAFSSAREKRTIALEPSDEQLARMMRDAAILIHTGQLSGRVLDDDGLSVRDAEVRIGSSRARTDPRGLFHLRRIPMGGDLPLVVETSDGTLISFHGPPVQSDFYLIGTSEFRLSDGQPMLIDDELLDEWKGDSLPGPAGAESRAVRLEDGDLREGDILLYRKRMASGEAELVSRFKACQHGQLIVHTLRLAVTELPRGARQGHHFRVDGGELVPIVIDASSLHMIRRARQAAAAVMADSPALPTTRGSLESRLARAFERMK